MPSDDAGDVVSVDADADAGVDEFANTCPVDRPCQLHECRARCSDGAYKCPRDGVLSCVSTPCTCAGP